MIAIGRKELLETRIKILENDMQHDPTPDITKDLHYAAVAVNLFDFRQINYDDTNALFLLSVFFTYISLSKINPNNENILKFFNKENAIQKLQQIDPRCVPKDIFRRVIQLMITDDWSFVEAKYSCSSEFVIVN